MKINLAILLSIFIGHVTHASETIKYTCKAAIEIYNQADYYYGVPPIEKGESTIFTFTEKNLNVPKPIYFNNESKTSIVLTLTSEEDDGSLLLAENTRIHNFNVVYRGIFHLGNFYGLAGQKFLSNLDSFMDSKNEKEYRTNIECINNLDTPKS